MVMVLKSGLMVLNTMVNGKTIKLTVTVSFGMFMAINMKEPGKETKLMAKENIPIATVQPMMDNGKTIYNMDLAKNFGWITRNILVTTKKERNMVKVPIHGMMEVNILESG